MKIYGLILFVTLLTVGCRWGHYDGDTAVCNPTCTVLVTHVYSGNEFRVETGQHLKLSGVKASPPTSPMGELEHRCLSDLIEGEYVDLTVHGWDRQDNRLASISSHRVTCKRSLLIKELREGNKENV